MRQPVSNSLIAKLTTGLRFNALEMMLWAWIIAQFVVDNYYERILQAKEQMKEPGNISNAESWTDVIPAFINSAELVIASAILTKATTTGYEFPKSRE